MYPLRAGTCISSATSRTTSFSGVTISSSKVSAINETSDIRRQTPVKPFLTPAHSHHRKSGVWHLFLRCRGRLQFLGLLEHFLDGADHVERLFGHIVMLALENFVEAAHCVFDLDVAALHAGELLGNVEGLRQELLDFAGARHRQLIVFTQFIDSKNGND